MGNSNNVSIDRLDGLKFIYELQKDKKEISLVELLKIKACILKWLEEEAFIFWNESKTKVSITEKGILYLTDKQWI
jgi:hypothetical protein